MSLTVILTHEHADFDAVASLAAAGLLYPGSIPVLPRRTYRNVSEFLEAHRAELPFQGADKLPRQPIGRIVVVDSQSWTLPKRVEREAEIEIIDHHPLSRELNPRTVFRGQELGATVTLLVEELVKREPELSSTLATLMLLGLYEDTGQLTYQGTTPRDVRAAAWLLERGARLDVTARYLRQALSEAQQELFDRLAEQAELLTFAGQPVVVAAASAPGFNEEIASLAHKVGDLFEPAACFLLVQLNEHIQLVARSHTPRVDVGHIAAHFGGGGHGQAAAAFIRARGLEETRAELLQLLQRHVRPRTTAHEIMSFGVQTLTPETRMAEAEEAARRYGHEGFPVVEGGRLVGILTRGEIDRAVHHGLGQTTVDRYMRHGPVSVPPDASLEEVQAVMNEHDLGQVPVVQDGRVLGIVTRTDLIKVWGAAGGRGWGGVNLAGQMEAALPGPLLQLVHRASDLATQLDFHLHLVGGFVRDLILGQPNLDIDLVVEGDAIRLARRLAREKGGRVVGHARFGTAKWLLPEELTRPAGVPGTLDFATARREVYEGPTALPEVERSSIKQDLFRRDFTINAMALSLDRDRYGQLLDFYGGERDLRLGLIRVLHTLSFVEDPTRALRAVRLAERLGFQIEARTLELLRSALDLIPRVSGERLRAELALSFGEAQPERIFTRLGEYGILAAIHPRLEAGSEALARLGGLEERWAAWRELAGWEGAEPPGDAYLAALALELGAGGAAEVGRRLAVSRQTREVMAGAAGLAGQRSRLAAPELPPSQVYRLLQPIPPTALFTVWAASGRPVRERIEAYVTRLKDVEPLLTGHDLKAMGLPPGPLYRRILEALREARLDGQLTDRQSELDYIETLLTVPGAEG